MKKYYFALVLTLFVLPFFAQNIPSYVPKDGLVGWWPFNGNANDESGNGNHGTVNGATLTTDRNDAVNSAYQFGINKWIAVNDDPSLRPKNISIAAWVKIEGDPIEDGYGNKRYPIFYKGGYEVYRLEADAFHIKQDSKCAQYMGWGWIPGDNFTNNYKYDFTQWHFVIGVFDGTNVKLFIDGKLIQSVNTSITEIDNCSNPGEGFKIGRLHNMSSSFFNGSIDDLSIWNRALSEQEISKLFKVCSSETATSSNFNSLLLSTGSSVSLSADPQGGVFTGVSIDSNKFVPSKAKIGANKVQYNFKNSQGCDDSTLFTMIVADTVGMTCKKYDTVIVPKTVTKYDTVKVNTYDTITVKNNVYDTVIINKTKYDTITVTNNVTKYDTVIVKTNVFDTVKVNKYDTIIVTNNITKYDTVIVPKTITKYDTVIVNKTKYDTITVTNNVTKYDTVIVPKTITKYDTVKVNTYDTITVTNSITKYDTVLVNKYDTIKVTDTVSILNVNFKLTTGLQANQMASMSVYPNPTSDVLHIEIGDAKALEGYRYRILDALGKEVYNELVKNAITEIPLKTLGAAGMYQLEVLDANKTSIQTNKIVLQ